MTKQKQEGDPKPTVVGLRKVLASGIAAHAQSIGEHSTAIPGLILFRQTASGPCYRATFEPGIGVFVQGRKLIKLNGRNICAMDLRFCSHQLMFPSKVKSSRPPRTFPFYPCSCGSTCRWSVNW